MSGALQFSLHIVSLQCGSTMALSRSVQKHAEPIRADCMFKHTVFMSGHCMHSPAASTSALRLGCDMLAVAQRRQSFSVLLLPLLSSVIKGRGKSRGDGWALIAFHGREERAAACPEGLRRC